MLASQLSATLPSTDCTYIGMARPLCRPLAVLVHKVREVFPAVAVGVGTQQKGVEARYITLARGQVRASEAPETNPQATCQWRRDQNQAH